MRTVCIISTREVFDMETNKQRHNLTFSPEIWNILTELKRVQGKSISQVIEEAVKSHIKSKGYNGAYFKMMADSEYCDDRENEELTKVLDSLTELDLEISAEYEI